MIEPVRRFEDGLSHAPASVRETASLGGADPR